LPKPTRTLRPAFLAAVLVFAVAACGVKVDSTGTALGTPSPSSNDGDVVGSNANAATSTTEATTTTTTPPPTDVHIIGSDGSPENDTVANAIADLESWWSGQFSKIYGEPYTPITGGFHAVDSESDLDTVPCPPEDRKSLLLNAYYCPTADAIVWDQEQLMPYLAKNYGAITPAIAIAHEWGHAIQERAEFQAAVVIGEQQADCFAGAWVKHERADSDARFHITTDDLDKALGGLLFLRDAPGSSADDPNAHGSGFDRVRAFQEGYESGTDRCAEYRDGDPQPFQFPFSDQTDLDNNGNLPLEGKDGILASAFPSLDGFWKTEFPKVSSGEAWKPLKSPVAFDPSDPPTCNGKKVTDFLLFVCIPDRYIAYDDTTTMHDTYDDGGDFAVATLIATQYGLDIEDQLGDTPSDEVVATLEGDCYAGAWAAGILPGVQQATDEGIQLSPGDLDEAVSVLLKFRSADERSRQGPGFDRVRAFGVGVTDGAKACPEVRPG
jgi:predicted metalloprotease